MYPSRRHRWQASLALIAMLLAALVPTLRLAWPTSHMPQFNQVICSTQGQAWAKPVFSQQATAFAMALALTSESQPNPLPTHLKHCPFCQWSHDNLVLAIPHPANGVYPQALKPHIPHAYQAPVLVLHDLSAHPSRAPPQVTHA